VYGAFNDYHLGRHSVAAPFFTIIVVPVKMMEDTLKAITSETLMK